MQCGFQNTLMKIIRLYVLLSLLVFISNAYAQEEKYQIAGKYFPYLEKSRPKVALVLSGGGSRGISQIGVIEALEAAHIPIDLIVGTSMGSIIGGLYASGYSGVQLDSIALSQNWNQLLALSDAVSRSDLFLQQKLDEEQSFLVIRLNGFEPVLPSALANGQRLTTLLTRLVLNAPYRVVNSFNDLKIPFRAVATDMVTGKRVVISTGDLAQAMRASSTVPVVFTPIRADSLRLVDGGLVSNIPVDIARSMGANLIIAVNTTSPLRPERSITTPWDALDQVTSIMMQQSNRLELEKADVVITPHLNGHYSSDFNHLDSLIQEGRIAAESKIAIIDSLYRVDTKKMDIAEARGPDRKIVLGKPHLQTDDTLEGSPDYDSKSLLFLSSVRFSGAFRMPDSVLIQPFRGLLGHYDNPVQINSACENLIWIYRNHDLGMARISDVSYDPVHSALNISINEGEVSSISLLGNIVAKPFLIRREFPLEPEDIFTTSQAIEGINNIYSTNLFSQVLLWTKYDPSTALTIDVTEKSSRLFRFGLRADNERNGQVFASLSDDDLFGTGTRAGFSFAGGSRNRLGEMFLGTTRILNTDLTYDFRAFTGFRDVRYYVDQSSPSAPTVWDLASVGEYRIIRSGYEFSMGTQIRRFGMVSATLDYGWDRIKPLHNFSTSYSARLVDLKIGSFVDTRDRSAFPRTGILSDIYFETSLKGLNSQQAFSRIYFDYETYQTAFSSFTFKQHYIFGFGDNSLPLSRQFSLGGQDLFYGLQEDALRGRQIFLASAELRVKLPIKIFFDTYLAGRFDLGDVWAQQENIVLKTLKQGIGMSLGVDTPIGPFVVSVGKAFYPGRGSKLQTLSTPWQFYFKIGVEIPTISSFQ